MINRTPSRLLKSFAVLVALVLSGMAAFLSSKAAMLSPFTMACLMLVFLALKSRRIIDDFLGLREHPGLLRNALLAWPLFFAAAALIRVISQGVSPL